jgi:hypothetical protein
LSINQCLVREIGPVRWYRVEWLPSKEAVLGKHVTVDGILIRDGKVYKDTAKYEVVTVHQPAMPDDLFKKEETK